MAHITYLGFGMFGGNDPPFTRVLRFKDAERNAEGAVLAFIKRDLPIGMLTVLGYFFKLPFGCLWFIYEDSID